MSVKAQIELLGAALQLGETVHELCPICMGGSQSEKSLAITRGEDGNLLYICHRASCNTKGGSGSGVSTKSSLEPPVKRRKVFEGEVVPLPPLARERIAEMWGIEKPDTWYWTPSHGGRVAMSIRSPKYMHRGWVLRDIRGRSKIKALTYINEGEESLSWYRTYREGPTILVEDIPSAVRASAHATSVALLGTGIGLDRAAEIAEYAPRPIIIALDQDATSAAFDIVLRYAALWGETSVLMLKKDLKDMSEEELQETLHHEGTPCTI